MQTACVVGLLDPPATITIINHISIIIMIVIAAIMSQNSIIIIIIISHISIIIIVVIVVAASLSVCNPVCLSVSLSFTLSLSLYLSLSLSVPFSTQPVKADGCSARAWLCSRFLPLKRKFFLATVTKCLLIVGIVGSL